MRVHPISLALRYLQRKKHLRAAPYYGKSLFENETEAVELLREATGQDFGTDAERWGRWLQKNRRAYYSGVPRSS